MKKQKDEKRDLTLTIKGKAKDVIKIMGRITKQHPKITVRDYIKIYEKEDLVLV